MAIEDDGSYLLYIGGEPDFWTKPKDVDYSKSGLTVEWQKFDDYGNEDIPSTFDHLESNTQGDQIFSELLARDGIDANGESLWIHMYQSYEFFDVYTLVISGSDLARVSIWCVNPKDEHPTELDHLVLHVANSTIDTWVDDWKEIWRNYDTLCDEEPRLSLLFRLEYPAKSIAAFYPYGAV